VSLIRSISITGVEYALPEEQAYGMARGLTSRRGGGLLRLETEDGVVGLGEVWGPSAIAAAYLDLVRPYFIGTDVHAQRGVQQMILAKHYHFGTQNALIAVFSGIDIAAHDAIGRTLGRSVCDLIGGRRRDRVPVYASGGYFTRETDQLASLARQLEPHANRGFQAFKIKIGRNPTDDRERVRVARQIIGEAPMLAVDSNGNYTLDQALESMRAIADFRIGWYEEPLAPQDWRGYQALRQRAPMPIATGEALYEQFDFFRLVNEGLADVLQPDLALCGGLSVARFVGELASTAHLRVSPHVWGTAVGLAAAVHWVASLSDYPHNGNVPTPTLVEYDIGSNPLRDTLLAEPLRLADGYLDVPNGPGLGITIAADVLERHRVAG
jgi:D-galactarolactone cycloisomerase